MVSKLELKKILIFVFVLFTVWACVIGFWISERYTPAALNSVDLDLQRLKPKPPTRDCSELHRTLARLIRPKNVMNKVRLQNRGTLIGDEVEIYRMVLRLWTADDRSPMYVSADTYPLDLSETPPCDCLTGVDPYSLELATHSTHPLTRSILPRENIRLVEPNGKSNLVAPTDLGNSLVSGRSIERAINQAFRNRLFSLSEIAFDTEHHRAIVSYSFVCGSLCGSGRTLLFEKVGGEWKATKLECGGWVS